MLHSDKLFECGRFVGLVLKRVNSTLVNILPEQLPITVLEIFKRKENICHGVLFCKNAKITSNKKYNYFEEELSSKLTLNNKDYITFEDTSVNDNNKHFKNKASKKTA